MLVSGQEIFNVLLRPFEHLQQPKHVTLHIIFDASQCAMYS